MWFNFTYNDTKCQSIIAKVKPYVRLNSQEQLLFGKLNLLSRMEVVMGDLDKIRSGKSFRFDFLGKCGEWQILMDSIESLSDLYKYF